jgi:hypothetical protein
MSRKYPSTWLQEQQIQKSFRERFDDAITRGWRVNSSNWLSPPVHHPLADETGEWLPFCYVNMETRDTRIILVPTYFWRKDALVMEAHTDTGTKKDSSG